MCVCACVFLGLNSIEQYKRTIITVIIIVYYRIHVKKALVNM